MCSDSKPGYWQLDIHPGHVAAPGPWVQRCFITALRVCACGIVMACWINSIIKQELYRPARSQGARLQTLIDDRLALVNTSSCNVLPSTLDHWATSKHCDGSAISPTHGARQNTTSMPGLSVERQVAHNPYRLQRKAEQICILSLLSVDCWQNMNVMLLFQVACTLS